MTAFIHPTVERVTSGFRTPGRPGHHGIDFAQPGYHEIRAVAAGTVSKSYTSSSYGECVMIVHSIAGQTYESVYAHLQAGSRRVKEGQTVKQGQVIGNMGNTGQSTGQHLHFELHEGRWNINKTNAVDPIAFLGEDLSLGKIVDFSHHQGNVNWKKAATELDLAIIRVQYGSNTVDRKYKEYVAGCKTHGIPFGHYAYCRFVSKTDAIKEAEDFHKRADKSALFLVTDVEEQTTKHAADMAPATQAFIDTLKAKGWKVGLYSGHHTYKPLGMNKVKADFIWIPRYGSLAPAYPCDLWQFTETGGLAGVSGNVDLNRLTGSKPLSYFTGQAVKQTSKELTLIEWMDKQGMDSSYAAREKLAAKHGIKGFEGLAEQNLQLFALLKAGKQPKEEDLKMFDKPSKAHEEAWKWACSEPQKYMDGTRPNEPVTREQLASILKRQAGK